LYKNIVHKNLKFLYEAVPACEHTHTHTHTHTHKISYPNANDSPYVPLSIQLNSPSKTKPKCNIQRFIVTA
jgi:hypothetical protein